MHFRLVFVRYQGHGELCTELAMQVIPNSVLKWGIELHQIVVWGVRLPLRYHASLPLEQNEQTLF